VENPFKMDDLGVPPILGNLHMEWIRESVKNWDPQCGCHVDAKNIMAPRICWSEWQSNWFGLELVEFMDRRKLDEHEKKTPLMSLPAFSHHVVHPGN
jgi:hypothetical protein